MVDVTVGVDDGDDGSLAAVPPVEPECSRCGLGADQRIDDDDAGVALDEGDVRQVESPDLIDAVDHLVEPCFAQSADCRHRLGAPSRGVAPQERVGVVVPHRASVGCGHDTGFQCSDEPAVGVGEVAGVLERQIGEMLGVGGGDGGRRRARLHGVEAATAIAATE